MRNDDIKTAIESKNYKQISEHLYRVQKIGSGDYTFRHHLETKLIDDINAKTSRRMIRVASLKALFSLNPLKVKIDCIGNIKLITNQ